MKFSKNFSILKDLVSLQKFNSLTAVQDTRYIAVSRKLGAINPEELEDINEWSRPEGQDDVVHKEQYKLYRIKETMTFLIVDETGWNGYHEVPDKVESLIFCEGWDQARQAFLEWLAK